MISATVRIANWRVEHDVIVGFYGLAKPALVSMYQYLTDTMFYYKMGKSIRSKKLIILWKEAIMRVQIDTIALGMGNIYVIRDQGAIIVDCGDTKKTKEFVKGIERISLKPEEIKLIVITHGHFDHIGTAADIKKLTEAKLAMHEKEKNCLEKGLMPLPPGFNLWGTVMVGAMKVFSIPFRTILPTNIDIVLDDNEFSLADYGIPGKVIHTPGHSTGSVSVLLESGDAFVGDLAANEFPFSFGPGFAAFGDSVEAIIDSWSLLLEKGAKMIYPGHGDPFPVSVIEEALAK